MHDQTDEQLAETHWNYNQLGMQLKTADVIIVLCSHDIQVTDRGAQLIHEGCRPGKTPIRAIPLWQTVNLFLCVL